jgi:putative restriction endonuclease
VLTEPFFLDEGDWIPVPDDWPRNVQRGFTYDTDTASGDALWQAVEERLATHQLAVSVEEPRFGDAYLARARLGQGTFRTLVTDAYHRRCAVTGERSLPALARTSHQAFG